MTILRIVVALLLLIGSIFLIRSGWLEFQAGSEFFENAKASADWPSVKGKILSSKVIKNDSQDKSKATYRAAVEYEYVIGREKYTSDNLAFGQSHEVSMGTASATVKDFPEERIVKVFYNPQKPSVATLKPGGITASGIPPAWVGILYMLLGGLMLLGSLPLAIGDRSQGK